MYLREENKFIQFPKYRVKWFSKWRMLNYCHTNKYESEPAQYVHQQVSFSLNVLKKAIVLHDRLWTKIGNAFFWEPYLMVQLHYT